jgi:peroxiredoxin
MSMLLSVICVFLAGVFILAGGTKLGDRSGTVQAVLDFGLPAPLAPLIARMLPVVELLIGLALLLPLGLIWYGAVGALVLLIGFTIAMVLTLVRGRRPDCNCFGQLHSAPISWKTIVRNVILMVLAGGIIWQGSTYRGFYAADWFTDLVAGQLLVTMIGLGLMITVLAEGWFLLHLFAQHGRLLNRIEGLERQLASQGRVSAAPIAHNESVTIGQRAPDFRLPTSAGTLVSLADLRTPDKPLMLVFADPQCGPCTRLLPELVTWQERHAAQMTLALISRSAGVGQVQPAIPALRHVLIQADREVATAYNVAGTPAAVLINPDGTFASDLALGAEPIRALVLQVVQAESIAQERLTPCRCGKAHHHYAGQSV